MTNSLAWDWILFIQYSVQWKAEINSCRMIFPLVWLCEMTTDLITVTQTKALGKRLECLQTCLLKYPTDMDRYYQCSQLNKSAITFSALSKTLLSIKIWRILLYNLACYRNFSIPSMHLILTTLHCLKIGDTVEFRWLKTRLSIIVLLFILTQNPPWI